MSKLYWKLRAGGAFKPYKYQIMHVWIRDKRNDWRKPIIKTYPSNRWGFGYWRRK